MVVMRALDVAASHVVAVVDPNIGGARLGGFGRDFSRGFFPVSLEGLTKSGLLLIGEHANGQVSESDGVGKLEFFRNCESGVHLGSIELERDVEASTGETGRYMSDSLLGAGEVVLGCLEVISVGHCVVMSVRIAQRCVGLGVDEKADLVAMTGRAVGMAGSAMLMLGDVAGSRVRQPAQQVFEKVISGCHVTIMAGLGFLVNHKLADPDRLCVTW